MTDKYKYQVTGSGPRGNFEADGSWHLKIVIEGVHGEGQFAPSENMVVRKRVRGDRDHVGGLIQKVVDTLTDEKIKKDWSEYELWWPEQRKWLLKHHWMLDKYSIQVNMFNFHLNFEI